jgi:hypothetical protein
MIEMTLVKSLYNGDPDVICPRLCGSGRADCLRVNKTSALQVLFGIHPAAVHEGSHMHWGEPC